MSETSISPLDFYELKHVRTIKDNTQAQRIQKKNSIKRNIRFQIKAAIVLTVAKAANISRSLKTISFQGIKMAETKKNIKEIQSCNQRNNLHPHIQNGSNQEVQKENASSKGCSKFDNSKKALANCSSPFTTSTCPSNSLITSVTKVPQLLNPQRVKTASDFHDPFYPQILSHGKEPRKSQITQYMTKMLKDTNPKLEVYLKPLSIFNRKSFQSSNAKSITQTSFSPHTHSHFQSGLLPQSHFHKDSIKQISKDYYKLNNKDLLKLIDSMKVKHRLIKCKNDYKIKYLLS